MTPAMAARYHRHLITVSVDNPELQLANASLTPTNRQIYAWHHTFRLRYIHFSFSLIRTKAYNPVALLRFTFEVLERYYQVRLLTFAHGRDTKNCRTLARLAEKAKAINGDDIEDLSNGQYVVPSSDPGVFSASHLITTYSLLIYL